MTDKPRRCKFCEAILTSPDQKNCCSRICAARYRHFVEERRKAMKAAKAEGLSGDELDDIKTDIPAEERWTIPAVREYFYLDERRPAKHVCKSLAECEEYNKLKKRP